MRIMHFISSPAAGGAEVYVRDLAIHMANSGHQVFIVFLESAIETGRNKSFEEAFLHALKEHGIDTGFIGANTRKNPLAGILRLRKWVSLFKPDILHCHLYYAAVFAVFSEARNIVYTHHNIELNAPKRIYQFLDFRIRAYVGICHACKLLLESVTRKPVTRIDNGVAIERIIPKSINPDSQNDAPTIIVVGRLTAQKNLALFLQAVKLLEHLPFNVIIAGEGEDRPALEKYVHDEDLGSRISFLGNVNNIPELLHSSDIFAMSSAWEGLPISQIEATLTGLPVIVTHVGGCSEIVHQCMNGIVVDELEAKEYAQCLARLIESPELRRQLSSNALRYSGSYRLEHAASRHLDLYTSLIAQGEK